MNKNNYILTIAGFDPSGGAGVLADIKTFEQNKCIGMAIQTANTIQTESEFLSVNWIDEKIVIQQLETLLLSKYRFNFIKIGLIPSLEFLQKVIQICRLSNQKIKFIWDPILSVSVGFNFNHKLDNLKEVLKNIYLITPNWDEVKTLSGNDDSVEGAKQLSNFTKVYLKGGHNPNDLGKDYLFEDGNQKSFNPKKTNKSLYSKHGSGCVLSSAIASNLNNGYTLQKSILKSKRYIEGFLGSNKSLIGRHRL